MEFNSKEKEYLKQLLKRELDNFKKDRQVFLGEGGLAFFQAEEDYATFLEKLIKKVK